ncbi:MAG: endonuclease domain-containing protein [Rhodanobacter sp.]|jgi:hypothetical protein|nr:endonuclease domain-containing protein [Rhodanobacter sp.]
MNVADPRSSRSFRFVRRHYDSGIASLVYAFDDGPELIERIVFPDAPALAPARASAFEAALDLLHLIAGISYYKAGVPDEIRVESTALDAPTASLLDALYLHGLGEFAYRNQLDLRDRIRFTPTAPVAPRVNTLDLPRRTFVPLGGGKDSLVSVELLKAAGDDATVVWIGHSPLIAACAEHTGLPMLNIRRELSPLLFDYNRLGAYNGHIPVTAINAAILTVAAILYGVDAIAFSNERSASSATLEYDGQKINHQWSKGWKFERMFGAWLTTHVAADLNCFSLLRPLSELAVAERFARTANYDAVFSSCNRHFRLLGPRPTDRWCGQCPKCHFVFLALAPFMPKPRLLRIFGHNLLDDPLLVPAFDALMEYREHKPFECVGEGIEARAAMAALAQRAEWREDAIVARFIVEIAPQLGSEQPTLDALLAPAGEHRIPQRLWSCIDAIR